MKNNEYQATINLTQMDREAVDHFTLSEILEMYPDVSGIIINDIEQDVENKVFYTITGLGRVIFPRHLNETLEDIYYTYYDNEYTIYDFAFRIAFKPYQYTFGDRHGYSAKFYIIDTTTEYTDTDSICISHKSKHCIRLSHNKKPKNCNYDGSTGPCDPGDCSSCKICDYYTPNPYQE